MRIAVLTISDGVHHGAREDRSGAVLEERVTAAGHEIAWRGVLPDEREEIAACFARLCDEDVADVVLSTCGTGFAPRDVTPEAARATVARLSPGIDEALRADALRHTPHGALSRGVSGTRARTIVITLPGSPRACEEGWAVLAPVLEHAVKLLRSEPTTHGR
jgi:molybdopterin adenylyltransferase